MGLFVYAPYRRVSARAHAQLPAVRTADIREPAAATTCVTRRQ